MIKFANARNRGQVWLFKLTIVLTTSAPGLDMTFILK